MQPLKQSTTELEERIARLERELSQSQTELEDVKQAYQQEQIARRWIESALVSSRQLFQLVMDTLPGAVFWKDLDLVYLGCNQKFASDAGLDDPSDIVGKTDQELAWKPEETAFYQQCDRRVMSQDRAELGIVEPQLRADGKQVWLETNKAPLRNRDGKVVGVLGTYNDITERKQAELALQNLNQQLKQQAAELSITMNQLQQSQLQLIQHEKTSLIGHLIAGVAHEINNPIAFLSGNLEFAQDHTRNLLTLIQLYESALPNPGEEIQTIIDEIELDYVRDDLPELLYSMEDGIQRIQDISHSLRIFFRADIEQAVFFDLCEGLDSTLLILKYRLKANEHRPAIELIKRYDDVPPIRCFPGPLNQVFMNVLANAIDALDESNQGRSFDDILAHPNRITLTTELSSDQRWVFVRIKDNGVGMRQEVQDRIFENSFTTKAVGKGTGLGLAIARQIIVEKHGGAIGVTSTLGEGTEFVVKIPTGL